MFMTRQLRICCAFMLPRLYVYSFSYRCYSMQIICYDCLSYRPTVLQASIPQICLLIKDSDYARSLMCRRCDRPRTLAYRQCMTPQMQCAEIISGGICGDIFRATVYLQYRLAS